MTEYNQQQAGQQLLLVPAVLLFIAMFIGPVGNVLAGDKIVLHALFANKAIIMIGDQRRVLAVGQETPEGLTLLSTSTQSELAEILFNGKKQQLHLGSIALSSPKKEKTEMSTTLWADSRGHFVTTGTINGVAVTFLVDTGATTIAMSSATARRVGIDYKRGRKGYASTASGVSPMYEVDIKKVKLGEIEMKYLKGGVIEGKHPTDVLLGMTFLNKVKMQREGNKLELFYNK